MMAATINFSDFCIMAGTGNIAPAVPDTQKSYSNLELAREALELSAENLRKEFPLGDVVLENDKVILYHAPHSGDTIIYCSIARTSEGYNLEFH